MGDVMTRDEIEIRIKNYIYEIAVTSNEDIDIEDVDNDLTKLEFNSVDYLEFIIKLEQEFDIDIPDEKLVDNDLTEINAWVDLVIKELGN